MLDGMYVYYVILGLGLGIVGVIYGIRLQMRQNFGKKLTTLSGNKVPYSQWVSTLGEPKQLGSCADENGNRCKTATWSAPGVSVTVRFDKDDYADEVLSSLVTSP